MRLALFPLTVNRFAPVPVIVKSLVMAITPPVSVIVCVVLNVALKTTVSAPAAAFASKIACRKLPAPLSFVFVTVNVAAIALIAEIVKISVAIVKVFLKRFVIVCIVSSVKSFVISAFKCICVEIKKSHSKFSKIFSFRRKISYTSRQISEYKVFMSEKQTSEITRILQDWNDGNADAKERLMPFVYDELKRQARFLMSRERAGHTLQPTALVHEAFMKLSEQSGIDWQNRSHFYGIASRLMRQILVDHARLHAAEKRGSNPIHFSLDDVQIPVEERADSILILNEVLERLEKFDEQQAKIVEMRFFGGMINAEIAESLKISERTVGREWQSAKLWLYRELNRK